MISNSNNKIAVYMLIESKILCYIFVISVYFVFELVNVKQCVICNEVLYLALYQWSKGLTKYVIKQ